MHENSNNRLLSGRLAYTIAFSLRIGLIIWGEWQDEWSGLRYTDVDYDVFTDAAALVYAGKSPYYRATYRYTPLLSWLMIPNIILHPCFGKLLFCVADMVVGRCIELILMAQGSQPDQALKCALLWLFNPVVANVSTRGSCDSITASLVLIAAMFATGRGKSLLLASIYAALTLSVAIHFRLYPVIYISSFAQHIGARWRSRFAEERNTGKFIDFFRDTFSLASFLFVVTTMVLVIALCLVCCYMYGSAYYNSALLYHLTRTDNRHNFSMYFYWIYLDYESQHKTLLGLVSFLPQAILVLATSFKYARHDLPMCLFLQTAFFVVFNKVCTGQYFIWYLSVLPLLGPTIGLFDGKIITSPVQRKSWAKLMFATAFWILSLLMWLFQAYRLEFLGHSVFLSVWLASVIFFAANVIILAVIAIINEDLRSDAVKDD